ncbi:UPF0704 protein C6orf165-like [Cricetulus griseus]|uniref:Cilia- and flagella-associated protein 206 n=1 Tax=Cricetulus griseus TaxID=10029 RepID=G3HJ40_CRIGR|nr:UPF0704 protein C6orf165-like [Cricetulus griseus]
MKVLVKAVVLDPSNGFNMDRTLIKNDVQKLVKLCVARLLDSKNPSLDTIKMQVYFDMNYTTREDFLEEHHRVLESRLSAFSREITDSRACTREELENLYRKIVSYVLLRSGLGSPTDITIVREATAALQSVFPQAEMGTFLTLNKKDKERQLKELTMIVTGIRLFNRDCGKGGEGIDDLPSILHEAIPTTTQHIDAQLQIAQDQAFSYTAILEKVTKNPLLTKDLEPYMLKEALYNIRQYEIFLQTVLPIFIALASLWMSFQDETVLISVLSNLTTNLELFLGTHELLFPEKVIQDLLDDVIVKSDMVRIKEHMEERVHLPDFRKMEWLFPETTANFDKLLIQYRGFCGYTFASTDGLLLPGNPAIGILKHKEKYYTFNTRDAACSFAENPEHYINLIKEKAKKNAELIQLLELHQQFETLIPYAQANLRQKITHSVQTDLSHMRRDNSSQVYPLKDVSTQSKREGSSRVPRPQIFIAGLRGGQSQTTHGVKVNLTRAVDET